MDAFEDHELAINWKLFKRCRYNHIMFNLNSTTIMNWNYYQISFTIATATFIGLLLFGSVGYFMNLDISFSYEEYIFLFYLNVHMYLMLYKMSILIYHAKKFHDIFNVTRIKFLGSIQCIKNRIILQEHRNDSIKKTNIYCMFTVFTTGLWILHPLVLKILMATNTETRRTDNILNFPFPITMSSYNKYYVIFFGIEAFIIIFLVYVLFMIDLFLLSFGWVIITQYKVIHRAIADIGHQYNCEKYDFEEYYSQFQSIIPDLINLDKKMKTYHSIVKPIVLVYSTVDSLLIILLSFELVLAFKSFDLASIMTVLKIIFGVLYMTLQLSLYCNLHDTMNVERESVSFGMYSCNWTMMDFKFQKLVLLAMRTNDNNRVILKFSPKKIIDMQFFSRVLITSLNMVSVMFKIIGRNQKSA